MLEGGVPLSLLAQSSAGVRRRLHGWPRGTGTSDTWPCGRRWMCSRRQRGLVERLHSTEKSSRTGKLQ
jgi:hypothetical protein